MNDVLYEEFIRRYKFIKDHDNELMQVLKAAQDVFSCIPIEIQKFICDEMQVKATKITAMIAYYHIFSEEPRAFKHLSVCTGRKCCLNGSMEILDVICEKTATKPNTTSKDGRYYVETTGCVGACSIGPVVRLEHEIHGQVKVSDIDELIKIDDVKKD